MLPEQSRTMAIEPVPSPYRPMISPLARTAMLRGIPLPEAVRWQPDLAVVELDRGPRLEKLSPEEPGHTELGQTHPGPGQIRVLLASRTSGLKMLKRSVSPPASPGGHAIAGVLSLELDLRIRRGATTGRPGGIWSSFPSAAIR